MRKTLTVVPLFPFLYFLFCTQFQESALDENSPNFIRPTFSIDTAASSLKPNDTIHFNSAILVLSGNLPQTRVQTKVDTGSWSDWKPTGTFLFNSLSEGSHVVQINTMYDGGVKIFYDTVPIRFFVETGGYFPLFAPMEDSMVSVDTGAMIAFPVNATGMDTISYQWYKGKSSLPGKIDKSLVFSSFVLRDTGTYRCVASNTYGRDTSRTFTLLFQPIKGGITGIIERNTDSSKLAEAIVTLLPKNLKDTSNSDGVFEFNRLISGTYSIKIEHVGFQEKSVTMIEINDSTVKDMKMIFLLPVDTGVSNLKVIYNGNGNTGGSAPVDQVSYKPGTSVTIIGNIGNLVKTGFVFNGWNSKADGSGTALLSGSTFVMSSSNIALYASWKPQPTFSITYDGNGKSGGAAPVDTNKYSIGDSIAILGNIGSLVKAGSSFAGWNTNAEGTGTNYNAGSKFVMTSASATLFAKWTNNPTFLVVYHRNGGDSGTVPAEAGYEAGVIVTASSNVGCIIKTGYVFSGWNTKANGAGTSYNPGATFIKSSTNDTLYAQWKANSYTITFDDQAATTAVSPTSKTVTVPATTISTLPTPPAKTGYGFGGWYTAVNGGGTEFTASTVVTANITVYAKWIVVSYTVTFDDQSATMSVTPTSKQVNSPASTVGTLPTQPIKTGYAFGGWYTATNGGGIQFTASTVVTVNMTVYAYWLTYSYTVAFDDQGATTPVSPTSKTVASPATTIAIFPTQPLKTAHEFGGWYTGVNGTGTEFTPSTVVTSNITVYAKWAIKQYKVTFNSQGGIPAISEQTINHGSVAAKPLPTPTKSGYTFSQWFTEPECATEWDFSTPITSTRTLYAKWLIKDCDGNTYTSVTIGSQVWIVENLMTTKYNDGSDIPLVTDSAAWTNLNTPGYCWYNNFASNKIPYGALYNGFVISTNKLAPKGWHIASAEEWDTLESYLISNRYNWDGTTTENKIAKSLAAKTSWRGSTNNGAVGNDPDKNGYIRISQTDFHLTS